MYNHFKSQRTKNMKPGKQIKEPLFQKSLELCALYFTISSPDFQPSVAKHKIIGRDFSQKSAVSS